MTSDEERREANKIYRLEAEAEHIFGSAFNRIEDMDKRLEHIERQVSMLPEMKLLLSNISSAQTIMSASAQSMADTFKRGEERAEKQEIRYDTLSLMAAGKDQIPLKSHYSTLYAALLPTFIMSACVVLYVLYYTKQEIKGSLESIEIKQAQTQLQLEAAKNDVKQKVSEIAGDVDHDAKERFK